MLSVLSVKTFLTSYLHYLFEHFFRDKTFLISLTNEFQTLALTHLTVDMSL